VIGNNTDTPNGYVETGSFGLKQKKTLTAKRLRDISTITA
jgi:hypothetical protein